MVPVFGSIWAPGSFLWIPVHKLLPKAQILPGEYGYLEYVSWEVMVRLTVLAGLHGAPACAGAARIRCAQGTGSSPDLGPRTLPLSTKVLRRLPRGSFVSTILRYSAPGAAAGSRTLPLPGLGRTTL